MALSDTRTATRVLHLAAGPLTREEYDAVVSGGARVELAPATRDRLTEYRASLLRQLDAGVRMYGVNTGYGADSVNALAPEDIREVQRNTLTSHAVGTGDACPDDLVRGMRLLKANVLAQGLSAVRPELVDLIAGLLNHGIAEGCSWVGGASC